MGRNQSDSELATSSQLDKAVSHAREAQGSHFDARSDYLDATTLRLEVLRLELAGLIKGRVEAERFIELQLLGGDKPRLWIDLVSYVVMKPTPRHYQLVRDRQDSSEVLFETENQAEMIEAITEYIANRIVLRERQMLPGVVPDVVINEVSEQKYSSAALVMAWFLGVLLGVIGLFSFGVWFSGG